MIYCGDCRYARPTNLPNDDGFACELFNGAVVGPGHVTFGCSDGRFKTFTNMERIQTLGVDALAKEIDSAFGNYPWCQDDVPCDQPLDKSSCVDCIKKWLLKEAGT